MKFNLKSKQLKWNSVVSLMVAVALVFTFSFALDAQTEEEIDEVESYLIEQDMGNYVDAVNALLDSYEGEDELAMDTIMSLIAAYADEEIDEDKFFEGINSVVRVQNRGLRGEDLDEAANSFDEEEPHGQMVADMAHELAEYADLEDTEREDIRMMAQELAVFAREKGEVTSAEMQEFVEEKKAEQAPENAGPNNGDENMKDKGENQGDSNDKGPND
ncbi:MAG: hypothetical protein ACQEQG_06800 [Bacillota bacterium]